MPELKRPSTKTGPQRGWIGHQAEHAHRNRLSAPHVQRCVVMEHRARRTATIGRGGGPLPGAPRSRPRCSRRSCCRAAAVPQYIFYGMIYLHAINVYRYQDVIARPSGGGHPQKPASSVDDSGSRRGCPQKKARSRSPRGAAARTRLAAGGQAACPLAGSADWRNYQAGLRVGAVY